MPNYTEDANCMGAWLMEDDGNETDVSGEGGTLIETDGDIPQDADRKFGDWSRDWEKSQEEYLTHADGLSTDISGVNQKLSVVTFFQSDDTSSATNEIITAKWDQGNIVEDRQYMLLTRSTEVARFLLSTTGSDSTAKTGGVTVYDTTWHHVAGVYNDTDIKLYVDGSQDGSAVTYSNGIHNSVAAFTVGANLENAASGRYLDGKLDDLAVFDRELTSVEISDINDNGLIGTVSVTAWDTTHKMYVCS